MDQKKKYTLKERRKHYSYILGKHPGHVPVIVDDYKGQIGLKKTKYTCPVGITMSEIMFKIRQCNDLKPTETYIVFNCNNELIVGSDTMGDLYHKYRDEDGGLYLTLQKENVFG